MAFRASVNAIKLTTIYGPKIQSKTRCPLFCRECFSTLDSAIRRCSAAVHVDEVVFIKEFHSSIHPSTV